MKETNFPCYYVDSDSASNLAQQRYKRLIWTGVILMFMTTAVESISCLSAFRHYTGYAVFGSSLMTLVLTLIKPERNWYKGRAIAESIKTLSWRYMMRVDPFDANDDHQNLLKFTERIQQINTQANQEGFIPKPNKHHADVITPHMEAIRLKNLLERKEYYKIDRIENQINWYSKKSQINNRMGNLCSWVIIVCQATAGIYLLKTSGDDSQINLNAIMIFIATSLIAIIELYKFKDLHQAYALTYQELNIIKTRLGVIQDEAFFNQFVLEAEQAISREHTMWLARRGD